MTNRLRPRHLLLVSAMTLLLAGLSAPPAGAHKGPGVHEFCKRSVPRLSYCPAGRYYGQLRGSLSGYNFGLVRARGYGGARVCAVVEVYNRINWLRRTYSRCGDGGAILDPPDFNGFLYLSVARVYNAEYWYSAQIDGTLWGTTDQSEFIGQ